VKNGTIRFEIADAAMSPEVDQLPRTSRDWHAIQHWVEIANDEMSVVWSPLEAPLIQCFDINTGKWLEKLEPNNTTFFSYLMNNYWHTSWKASQGGALTFQYIITSRRGGSDVLAASRFGWEIHEPLLAFVLPPSNSAKLREHSHGFITIDTPNVILQALKRAEDGDGFILRLREVQGKEAAAVISLPLFNLTKAWLTDIVEVNQQELPVNSNQITALVEPFGISTIRILNQ
jgi:hypothetical protein